MAFGHSPPQRQLRAINPAGYRILFPILCLSLVHSVYFVISQIASSSSLSLGSTSVSFMNSHMLAVPTNSNGESERLKAEIKNLQFELDMQRVRQAPIMGPISLKGLRKETQSEFGRDLRLHLWGDEHIKRLEDGTDGKSAWGQVPTQAASLMTRVQGKRWERHWTHVLIQTLIDTVLNRGNISPPEYPGSALELQQAMEDHVRAPAYSDPKILVAGSISPWVEAIALAVTNVSKVYMADWQPIEIEGDDRIECILMPDLVRNRPTRLFDVVVSFSSIEHDGLGRYGDPINPNGDLAAMAEFYTLLRPEGLLLLGIPFCSIETTNATDTYIRHWARLEGNVHRVYGTKRLERMMHGFTILERIDPGTRKLADRFGLKLDSRLRVDAVLAKWQPVFVLKKDASTKPLLLR